MATSPFDFDLFVSHASEDKEHFVRPLVQMLADAGLDVWFDEATLRPGDSLIQSIERGLSRSRFGIVVLSPSFFAKRWPRAELDALTSRELATGERVLLPVWLDVDADQVRGYSLLLADRYAIVGNRGLEYVASAISQRVLPGGSPLVIAREVLADRGIATPPPSDPWWLDVVESSTEPDYINIHSGLFRWGFPLPPKEEDPTLRGRRLAQAVMRDDWVAEADRRPITQVTRPEIVHEFIREMPGLAETCHEHPHYLATYAPQLLIPGFGGEFELFFDEWLAHEQGRGRSLETLAWHLSDHSDQDPAQMACAFVQGELHGPQVKYFDEQIDYFFWALSSESAWMPAHARETLIRGMAMWRAWVPSGAQDDESFEVCDALLKALMSEQEGRGPASRGEVLPLLTSVAERSRVALELPEPAEELARRLIATGAVEMYAMDRAAKRRYTPDTPSS
jgi:TIR domain